MAMIRSQIKRCCLWSAVVMFLLGFLRSAEAKKKSECENLPIQVYETDKVQRPYTIVGKAYVFAGDDFNGGGCSLMKIATGKNGNAIIQFEYNVVDYTEEDTTINRATKYVTKYSTSAYLLSGVVVRWAEGDEKGFRSLSKESATPIIEN